MPLLRRVLPVLCLALSACRMPNTYPDPSAGTYRTESFSLRLGDQAITVSSASVRDTFFTEANVQPFLGRLFLPTEYGAAAQRVAVISQACWKGRFGADPSLIGRVIQLDGIDCTIVGILPQDFAFPPGVDLWVPM